MEQQIQDNNFQNFSNNSDIGPSDSFLKAMIEVEETLSKFEMETLRRKRLKVDIKLKTKEWIPMAPGIKQICNELGISEVLGMMRGRATVIGRLTKKTEQQIMDDMFQFHRAMIELFQHRADDWELDEELAKPLLESCLSIVQDIIFSSVNGFTAMNIKSQYSRHENASSNMDNEGSKSILGIRTK